MVSCEEVTTSCCVGCVQIWVSSRSWPKEEGGGGDERERREKTKGAEKGRRERKEKDGGTKGRERLVEKGKNITNLVKSLSKYMFVLQGKHYRTAYLLPRLH